MKMKDLKTICDNHHLNIALLLKKHEIPDQINQSLARDIGYSTSNLLDFKSVILIGSGGRSFWEKFQDEIHGSSKTSADPIDDICIRFFNDNFSNENHTLIYPNKNFHFDILSLSSLLNFSSPSPLGLHINRDFGTWFAFRLVILSNVEYESSDKLDFFSPCLTCIDKPCLSACPAGATSLEKFNLKSCSDYRSKPDSACQRHCFSRRACPFQSQNSYSEKQLSYHMMHSYKLMLDLGD